MLPTVTALIIIHDLNEMRNGNVFYRQNNLFYTHVFFFSQKIKQKKKAEGKLSEKDEMSQKEKEIFEAQLMKEAEIRDRLKEARTVTFYLLVITIRFLHIFIVAFKWRSC